MAPDPRLVPGGWAEVRRVTEALHGRGIRVLLDMVLNHSGESDHGGPTLSYRGLDNATYYAADPHEPDRLVNDTGTGNTFAFWREPVMQLGIDALRAFVEFGGIDGFRYDLGTILGRGPRGLLATHRSSGASRAIRCSKIASMSWSRGTSVPAAIRSAGFRPLPRMAGSVPRRRQALLARRQRPPVGARHAPVGLARPLRRTRRDAASGVNFVAAHDGFTLADVVAYEDKHNEANGEGNRDGHNENHSWNNGAEGASADPAILAARRRDIRALLATLFVSRGNPMIVAGDEIGRSQGGNNNAYAQDNETVWVDWAAADEGLVAFTARLARLRADTPALRSPAFLTGAEMEDGPDVTWLGADGAAMAPADWQDGERHWLGARRRWTARSRPSY